MKVQQRKFRVETETIQQAGVVEAHANEIIFINKTPAVIVNIDGMPLSTNEFLFDGGHIGEWNDTKYNVTANAATFDLIVRRKIYTS